MHVCMHLCVCCLHICVVCVHFESEFDVYLKRCVLVHLSVCIKRALLVLGKR